MLYGFYFEDEQKPRAVYNYKLAQEYLTSLPDDIAFKIIDQNGNIVYQEYGMHLPMAVSQESNQMDTQSTPHGRRTFYERVQEQMQPSSLRRKDSKGYLK